MIKSKFKIGQVYLLFIVIIAFTVLGLYFLVHPEIHTKTKFGTTMPGSLGGVIILVFTWFSFYPCIKYANIIKVEADAISIKGFLLRKNISDFEIKSIDLFAKVSLGAFSGNTMTIATAIELINGEKIVIADILYTNIEEIKQSLNDGFKDKIIAIETVTKENRKQNFGEEVFVGNQFTSINGIVFYGLMIFVAFIIVKDPERLITLLPLFLIFFLGLFYWVSGIQMFYFVISDNNLIIRNHFFFWYKKYYSLDYIIEVNFESPYKRSDALRVTTSNFKSKLYSAGSLRSKTWDALKEKFIELGIPFKE